MLWNKKKEATKVGEEIVTGDKVTTAGYYIYAGHANPDEYNPEKCVILETLKWKGMLMLRNDAADGAMSCPHKVRWKLDQVYQKAKIDRKEYINDSVKHLKEDERTKEGELIESGQWVTTTGVYVYAGHVNPDEFKDCFIAEKMRDGMYFTAGTKAQETISCEHKIHWKLIEKERFPSLGPGEYFPEDIRAEASRSYRHKPKSGISPWKALPRGH